MYGDPKEETDGTELGRPKKLPGYQLVEEEGSHVDHIEEAVAYYDLVEPRLLFSVDDHCCDQIDDDNCREHCGKRPRIFRLLIYKFWGSNVKQCSDPIMISKEGVEKKRRPTMVGDKDTEN